MKNQCTERAEKKLVLAAETARLKREWAELKLETMRKRELSDEEFRTLAQYTCSYDPFRRIYNFDKSLLVKLPMKLASFTPASVKTAVTAAWKMQTTHWSFHLSDRKELGALPPELRSLIWQAKTDCEKIGALLIQRGDPVTDFEAGVFRERRSRTFHSDETFSRGPLLLARINLPPEFERPNGETFIADNNSLYLMAAGSRNKRPGTSHRSGEVAKPTPSLFLRHKCG